MKKINHNASKVFSMYAQKNWAKLMTVIKNTIKYEIIVTAQENIGALLERFVI